MGNTKPLVENTTPLFGKTDEQTIFALLQNIIFYIKVYCKDCHWQCQIQFSVSDTRVQDRQKYWVVYWKSIKIIQVGGNISGHYISLAAFELYFSQIANWISLLELILKRFTLARRCEHVPVTPLPSSPFTDSPSCTSACSADSTKSE